MLVTRSSDGRVSAVKASLNLDNKVDIFGVLNFDFISLVSLLSVSVEHLGNFHQ